MLIATVILAGIIVVLLLVIWTIKRHREPRLKIDTGAPLEELLPSLAGLTHSALVEGNSVELYENGAFFDALLADMAKAERSLHFDDRSLEINDEITAGCWSAGLARRFEEAFLADARHCVELQAHAWARRGAFHRLKDNAYYLLKYQL